MKQFLVTVLVAALVSFGTYKITLHNNVTETKHETAYDRVIRTGTLRCGYGMWPPNILVKNPNTGKLSGAMVDIMEELGKNLKIKIDWAEETGWGTWMEGLNTGRYDAFCASAYRAAERGRLVQFTSPIYYNAIHAYVRADDPRFDQGLGQLNDSKFKIATMDGEISARVADRFFPNATKVSIPQMSEYDQLFLNVTSKKADIVFNERGVVEDFNNHNPGKLKRVNDKPFLLYSASLAVGIHEDALEHMLDSALIEMQDSGTIDEIFHKHNVSNAIFMSLATPYKAEDK